jgi:hypothetical protein
MNLGTAYVAIKAKSDDLKRGLSTARTETDSTVGHMNKSLSKISWKAVAAGAAVAFGGVALAMREVIAAANEQESAETKLAAVVKATGEAAGYSAKEMFGMASELQKITRYGDETTISAMAVLATFKTIGRETFPDAIKASMDMATVMGTDLQSAVVMIGKAMNDPIANLSAMSRAGVQFTEDQKLMIKELWKAGDAMGAQKIILGELQSQFGGTAEAVRDDYGGAIVGLGNAFGDMKEQIGFAITKNEQIIGSMHDLEKAIIDITPAVAEFAKETVWFVQDVGWAIGKADEKLLDFYNLLIGNAISQSFISDAWIEDAANLSAEIDELLESYFDFETVAKSVAKTHATMADAVEDTYTDIGNAYDGFVETNKDTWRQYTGFQKKETKGVYDFSATTWHNLQQDMTREAKIMQDNWREHFVEPAKYQLHSVDDQNLMTLQSMRDDWDRESNSMATLFKGAMADAFSKESAQESFSIFTNELQGNFNRTVNTMVDDFVWGTNTMGSVGEAAATVIADSLGGYASQMYAKVIETLIDTIAVNIALGSAGSSSHAATLGGWPAALIDMGLYAGKATAAMVGAKQIANMARAEGGWVSEHPTGGWIRDGSGVHDDVYLGTTGNINHWGMGGEFVMNKQASEKYAPLLESLNRNYADGGEIYGMGLPGDLSSTEFMLHAGLGGAFAHGFYKGGPWGGLAEMIAFAASGIGGAFAAKAGMKSVNDMGWANGGRIDVGHGLFDKLKGTWDKFRGDVSDTVESIKGGNVLDILLAPHQFGQDLINLITPDILEHWMPKDPMLLLGRFRDKDYLLEILMESIRLPLRQVSKDLREPGKYYTDGIGSIVDVLRNADKMIEATTGVDISGGLEALGIDVFKNGTNYVPKDGLAYLHQGEAVVPAQQNNGAMPVVILVNGNVVAEDLPGLVQHGLDEAQGRGSGVQYQTISIDQIGLDV